MKPDNLPPQAENCEQTLTADPSARRTTDRRSRSLELWLATAFVLVHLVAPVVVGERYPFTISPMFCDQPNECCTYVVTDADGNILDAAQFNLHLVYDGNPPGLGMGIEPTETLHPYCVPCQREKVTDHVRGIMQQNGIAGPITITRRHLFPADYKIVEEADRWQVFVDLSEQQIGSAASPEADAQ